MLTTRQAARHLGVSPKTLHNWRYLGQGPTYVQYTPGGPVRYRPEDINRFIKERTSA